MPGKEPRQLRIVIGDSTKSEPVRGQYGTEQVVCRFGRNEGIQLLLVKDGATVTLRIQGGQLDFEPRGKNARGGPRGSTSPKPRAR